MNGCNIDRPMFTRVFALGIFLVLAGTAQAAVLRVSAEPPFSSERLGDAIRSYLDGAEVTIVSPPGQPDLRDGASAEPGVVYVTLRRHDAAEDDAEVVLLEAGDTIISRLPGAMRIEDLYRAAALKVQALLQRRMAAGIADGPVGLVGDRASPEPHGPRDRLLLDADLVLLLPSDGLARQGLRLGAGLRFARRGRLGLGAYLEAPQSTHVQGIEVSTWEVPVWLSLGFAWHQGRWLGWLDAVGHAAVRRISAESPGIVSNSDTSLSPRAGGAIGFGLPIRPDLHAQAQVSVLGVLADTRYRVDDQVVSPSARMLVLLELGLAYGLR